MPRSVIDIDIRDEKWKKFVESFKEYQGSTEKLNEVWKNFDVLTRKPRAATEALDKAIGRARKSSEAMGKTWAQVSKHIGDSDKKLAHFERTIQGVERGLSKVARIGLSLGKFALAAGGLGAVGGLFGMDALANSALKRQKSARGLGMPIGQVSAWDTYMSKYLGNPHGTLASIINARQTPQGQAALVSLGFTPEQYKHPKNRMAFAEQVIEHIRSLYLRHKAEGNEQLVLQARGVQHLGVNLNEARLFSNTPNSELHKTFHNMGAAAKQLQVPGGIATAWANLSVQLHKAGLAIETAFTNKLVKLAPLIGQLSGRVVKFIDQFMNAKEVGSLINTFGTDLKGVVQFMESKKFQNDMAMLGQSATLAAKALLGVAKVVGSPAIKAAVHVVEGAFRLNSKMESLYNQGIEELMGKKKYEQGHAKLMAMLGLSPAAAGYYTNPTDWRSHNNPGDISKVINGHREYKAFPTMGAGYRAMANIVRGYHKNTVAGIVGTYEGHNAKHLAAHIAAISRMLQVKPHEQLNLRNNGTMSKLLAGMSEFEHPHRQNMKDLSRTIEDAIVNGMEKVHITVQAGAGSRIFTAAHAASH